VIGFIPVGKKVDALEVLKLPKNNYKKLLEVIHSCNYIESDITKLTSVDLNNEETVVEHYFITSCSIGNTSSVKNSIKDYNKKKKQGENITFKKGPLPITILVNPEKNNNEKFSIKFNRGYILNGRSSDNLLISPFTLIDDGLSELCIFGQIGTLDKILIDNSIKNQSHLNNENVNLGTFNKLILQTKGKDPIFIESEGEIFGKFPATFLTFNKFIKIIVPKNYYDLIYDFN
jgi:diacylglycerol kinase family enzyme